MAMLTNRKEQKLLAVGEDVFVIENGKVEAMKVKHIYANCISVSGGFLAFKTAGEDWWLAKKSAEDALENMNANVSSYEKR